MYLNRGRWWLVLVCGLLLATWPRPGYAQTGAVTWQIVPGFDGAYKAGAWFPVTITVANSGPDVRGTVSVRLQNAGAATYSQTIELPLNANKRLVIPVASDTDNSGNIRAEVALRDGSTVVQRELIQLNALNSFQPVVGVISDQPGALPELANLRGQQPVALLRLTGAAAPERSELLQTFDVLFLHATDTTTWTDAQRTALRAWVASGGQLVIGGDALVARGLGDLLPAQWAEQGVRSDLQALAQLGWQPRAGAPQAPLLSLQPQNGAEVVVANAAGQPLIVRAPVGLGLVQMAAFSLDALRDAGGDPAGVWQRALRALPDRSAPAIELRSRGFWTLQQALKLPALRLPSILGFLGFLLLYIVVVGPLNYLVLRRLDRREWAYLTVPALVLIFSGAAYVWGTLGRGEAVILNELSLVRVLPNTARGQATTYLTLFSPTRRAYDFGIGGDGLLTDLEPAFNRQGPAMNILYAETGVQAPELLVDVGGTRALVAEHLVDTPQVSATIAGGDVRLRNLSDQALEDLALVRGDGQAQPVGALGPGEERTVQFAPTNFVQGLAISSDGTIDRQVVLSDLSDPLLGFFSTVGPVPEPLPPAAPSATPGTAQNRADNALLPQNVVYLIGWQSRATMPVTLNARPVDGAGETLYVWSVQREQ